MPRVFRPWLFLPLSVLLVPLAAAPAFLVLIDVPSCKEHSYDRGTLEGAKA